MSDVTGEAKVLVKNYTQGADKRVWSQCVGRGRVKVKGNRWVWKFLELYQGANKYKFNFLWIQEQEI